jgi:DNA polymerase-3 subunit alpha
MAEFVHLHTHSEYSLLDGAASVSGLVGRAVELGMPALALTDHGAMYGAVDFFKTARKAGIKPVLGCEVYFTTRSRLDRGGKPNLYHLLLLARNDEGYRNLMAIVSDAWISGFHYRPQVDEELLRHYSKGLIGTSACMSGILSKSIENGEPDTARLWAQRYSEILGPDNFCVELQQQGIVADNGISQYELNAELASLAREVGLPLVGTNDIHYVRAEDAKTQDMLLCIQTGKTLDETSRMRFSSDQFFMRTADEMAEALSDYPEAISNTGDVAERCNVELEFGKILLPVFDVPERFAGMDEQEALDAFLEEQCLGGMRERYGDPIPAEPLDRLYYELGVIRDKGFAGYFLVVQDFIAWARASGIGVGPGRGSAAGSIIAYALRITALDPLEHGLLFERFLNPERTEMPDIDIDFDDERRGEVIDYVRKKYGEDKVAQVITFSTMKARAAVRDAGRILGYPFGVPDKIAKMIQEGPEATIAGSLKANPELKTAYNSDVDTKRIIDAALALEGFVRGEGVHAAGVVICRDPLHFHMPIKRDTKGEAVVTQYEGKLVAALGLLKMDFLGLRTLTVIAKALAAIKETHGVEIDIETIPMDDKPTYELLRRGDVDGVFQVESGGMRQLLKDLKPTQFSDVAVLVALYRPGPLQSGMVRDFVERKHGRQKVVYYDERIKHILEETHGTMVYQELDGHGRLPGGEGRQAAQGHGQEGPRGDGEVAPGLRGRRRRDRVRPPAGRAGLRRHREVRRLRLQQEPLRGLRAHRLPDRVSQGALPARVHGRGAVELLGQDREHRQVRGCMQAWRHPRASAGRQLLGRRLHRGGGGYPLRSCRGAQRRRRRGRRHRRGAPRGRAVHFADRLLPAR